MRASAPAIPTRLVILRCPSCAAAEPVDEAALAQRVGMIQCRQCGERWPLGDEDGYRAERVDPASAGGPDAGASRPLVIEGAHRPLSPHRDPHRDPDRPPHRRFWRFSWPHLASGETEAEAEREAERPRRWAARLAGLLALTFLAAFVFGRETVVSVVPHLGGLYAAVGLPVNLSGLSIENLQAVRPATRASLEVSLSLANPTSETLAVPAVLVELRDARQAVMRTVSVPPPVESLPAGAAAPFAFNIGSVPDGTASVVVRLAAPRYGMARVLMPNRNGL